MTDDKTRSGTFLVGGAVRDALLGRDVSDRDWVVVGKTADAMLADGYTQVGKDFPVFLHPDSHEEYALARTERKTAAGHLGFECDASPDVTLEDDLLRRDLTVNALAQRPDGTLIDPYGGEQDLRDGVLRHVSPAFAEDPLRILRVARFAAQLGFRVASETNTLMRTMVSEGALDELPAERVWQEFHKALGCADPLAFVRVLNEVGGLVPWFVELRSIAADAQLYGRTPLERYGSVALLVDAGAAGTLGERIKSPNRYQRFAQAIGLHADTLTRWRSSAAPSVLKALQFAGALQSGAKERRADFLALLATLEAAHGEFEAGALARLSSTLAELGADDARRAAAAEGGEVPEGPALGQAIATLRTAGIERAQTDG